MTIVTEKLRRKLSLKTLPEFALLTEHYPKNDWLIIGTLTHAKPTSAATQLRHFRDMIHALGEPNKTFGHRLHWIVRVGGGNGTDTHTHLHFLLSRHQLTNGHRFSYTPDQVVEFIADHWTKHGMKKQQRIQTFDSSCSGISYVLRDESREQERIVEMSQALTAFIKKKQKQQHDPYAGRDPLSVEIIKALRNKGAAAGFGDQMTELRSKVAA